MVAPSRELLATIKDKKTVTPAFLRRYRQEMKRPEARQVIELLAALAQRTPISIGCFCPNEDQCHRSVLIELIREAARE